jgi:translation initiation factor 2D
MYPTVYTLWRNPGIVPLLHCGSHVIERLQGGADLMIPGLIYGPPFPEKAKKGAIVAVAGHDRPSVPVVVGTCEVDISALQVVTGIKGHAVENFHWYGDEIWSWNASGKPGVEPPENVRGWFGDAEDVEKLQGRTEQLDLGNDGERGGVALTAEDITNGDDQSAEEEKGRDFTTPGMLILTGQSY